MTKSLIDLNDNVMEIVLSYLEFDDYDSISQLKNIDMKGPVLKKLKVLKQASYKHFNSEEEKIKAVQRNGDAIQYINNPSEDLCKLAVQRNGFVIKYIKQH